MAIINQSTLVLILIISCSVALDLFGRSNVDTQEMSLNVLQVPSLLTFEKSRPKHYLISQTIYLLIMFVYLLRNSKGMKQLLWMGASFYYLKMPVNLTQHRGAVGTFNTRQSIFQRSREIFSFLNYVNSSSFQSYSLSTFILFVFLFPGLKYNGHKTSIKFFVWFLFLTGVSLNTSHWLQIFLVLLSAVVNKSRS